MRRILLLSLGLTASLASNVETRCDPEPDIAVALEAVSEDVPSLPVLSSGKSRLLDIDLPDAHGEVRVKLKATNAPAGVTVKSLSYQQAVDGQVKDVRILAQRKNGQDFTTGQARSDDAFQFHWRTRSLSDALLPQGRPHVATVQLAWEFAGCRLQSGTASADVSGTVKAAASATHLQLVRGSAEAFRPDSLKGVKAKLQLKSAVGDGLTNLQGARFTITYLGDADLPLGIGLAGPEKVALQSGGQSRNAFGLSEVLDVYTSHAPSTDGAVYEHAGTFASTGLVSGGKALLQFTVSPAKQSQPSVSQVDTFAEPVDVK